MSDTPETGEVFLIEGNWNTFAKQLKRERDEAQATLTDIHRWIERNHPDGFIDSMTFHQNLERVADRWYDRLDNVERERDEAQYKLEDARQSLEVALMDLSEAKRERDEAREELHKASVEANALATSIQKAEYSDAKEFELLGSVAGVISQIDNMYAGVRQQRDEAREQLRIAIGLLSTQPQFADKHPEDVLAFVKEGAK